MLGLKCGADVDCGRECSRGLGEWDARESGESRDSVSTIVRDKRAAVG